MGLAGLLSGPTLPAYSKIRVGFHLGPIVNLFSWSGESAIEAVRQAAIDCLWGSNAFYDLNVSLTDTPTENYLLIQATTVFDFSDKEDVAGYIWQQLDSCGISQIKSHDPVAVDAIPAEFGGDVNYTQPGEYKTQTSSWLPNLSSNGLLIGAAVIGGIFLLAKR